MSNTAGLSAGTTAHTRRKVNLSGWRAEIGVAVALDVDPVPFAGPVPGAAERREVRHRRAGRQHAAPGRGQAEELAQPREADLLEPLLRNAGQVLSREQLLDQVWGLDFDPGSNVVDVYVGYLRRKLGADAISTVRGMGYRLDR